jgi:nucleoside-diphosphate-sugar epimerase
MESAHNRTTASLPGTDARSNGLAASPPRPGTRVLLAGGAGYIGCVLAERLLGRGYAVRILDRLWWGDEPLATIRDRIELVQADVRDVPPEAFDGVDAVINLAGLSNDPTAEYDPDANWQMNAVATEALGHACVQRGIDRFVFASSCSLYDGLPPGMHDETTAIDPRGAYATSKRYAEEALLSLVAEGLDVGIVRNGTVYGFSPRMRFDLVVNTFVKDALQSGRLELHGGGWMWRPLVDVRDCADAMIAILEAPAERIRGEIFNVLHANYQIRELAFLVAGSVQLTGRAVELVEVPAPELTRNYECSNAKLAMTLGFNPSRSVVEAVSDLLPRMAGIDPGDPRHYNIRWLEEMRSVL